MQLGYVIFTALAPERRFEAITYTIVLGTFMLAYAVWHFFERSAHRSTQLKLIDLAGRAGFSVGVKPIRRTARPA